MALFRGSGTKEVQFTRRLFGQSLTENCSRARSPLQKVKVNSLQPCSLEPCSAPPRGGVASAWRGVAVGYRTRRALAGRQSSRHWTRGTRGTLRTAQDITGPGTFRPGNGGRSGRPTPARRLRLRRFPWPGPRLAAGLWGPRGNCRPPVDPEPRRARRGRAGTAAELVCARVEQVRRGGDGWVPASRGLRFRPGTLPPPDASVPGPGSAVRGTGPGASSEGCP